MNILYITNGISGSAGLERVLSVKSSYFSKVQKYNITIVTLNDNNFPFYQFNKQIDVIDIKAIGGTALFIYIKRLFNVINVFNPDIVFVCDDGIKGLFLPLLLRRFTNAKLIYERHISKAVQLDRLTGFTRLVVNKIMDLGSTLYDHFVVLTNGNAKEWPLAKGLEVIPNPLPFSSTDISSVDRQKVILGVGKYCHQKGFDLLAEIWSTLHQDYPDWRIEIYGEEIDGGYLRKLVYQLGIYDSFFLHPPTKDIKSKYESSSIFVLPSRYEGFGMVLLEAMNRGLPCVAFDCEYGPADIISCKSQGLIVENGNIHQFQQKLRSLILDARKRSVMGEKAIVRSKMYTMENIASQWTRII